MNTALNTSMRKAMFGMSSLNSVELMPFVIEDDGRSDVTPPLDLSSLDVILRRVHRSNSWAYQHGLVPMYDLDGREIENRKTPPWPWEMLPPPVVKAGKKAWLTRHIDQWIARMSMRASDLESTHGSLSASQAEVAHV